MSVESNYGKIIARENKDSYSRRKENSIKFYLIKEMFGVFLTTSKVYSPSVMFGNVSFSLGTRSIGLSGRLWPYFSCWL